MNLIFSLIRVAFVATCIFIEMALEWVHWKLFGNRTTEEKPKAKVYGAPRPWLAKYLPGVARLMNVVKEATIMFTNNSLCNRRAFKPVPRD